MKASITKIRAFKSCRRAYELRYIEGLKPVEVSDALETGRSYHEKLEELYKTILRSLVVIRCDYQAC